MEEIPRLLNEMREEIICRWEERVRKEISSATNIYRPTLLNDIPLLLDKLAEEISEIGQEKNELQRETHDISEEHGQQRARFSRMTIDQIIHEIHILEEVIFDLLENENKTPLDEKIRRGIRKFINIGLRNTAKTFMKVSEEIKEQYTTLISHDLRNPLAAIKANAQMILRYQDDSEKHLELAGRIVDIQKRIDDMIQDILDSGQLRAGKKIQLRFTKCGLNELITETLREMELIHGKRFRFYYDEVIEGFWNKDALRRAIENLLNNALKYGEGGKEISLKLGREREQRVQLSVHNHGHPIPAEDQKKLFDLFQRTSSSLNGQGTHKGWGVGLTLVKGIIEAHSGDIHVESDSQKGTNFTLILPLDSRTFLDDH